MPFMKIYEGKNKGKFKSPTGKIMTEEQVKAYYAKEKGKMNKGATGRAAQ